MGPTSRRRRLTTLDRLDRLRAADRYLAALRDLGDRDHPLEESPLSHADASASEPRSAGPPTPATGAFCSMAECQCLSQADLPVCAQSYRGDTYVSARRGSMFALRVDTPTPPVAGRTQWYAPRVAGRRATGSTSPPWCARLSRGLSLRAGAVAAQSGRSSFCERIPRGSPPSTSVTRPPSPPPSAMPRAHYLPRDDVGGRDYPTRDRDLRAQDRRPQGGRRRPRLWATWIRGRRLGREHSLGAAKSRGAGAIGVRSGFRAARISVGSFCRSRILLQHERLPDGDAREVVSNTCQHDAVPTASYRIAMPGCARPAGRR